MKRQLIVLVVAFITAISVVSFGQATLTELPVPVQDLSPDGEVVVGSNSYWTEAGGLTALTSGYGSRVVNNPLLITGTEEYEYMGNPGISIASYWTEAAGWTQLGGIPGAEGCGASLSSIWNVSDNGRYAAGHGWRDDVSCKVHGIRYDLQTGELLRLPGIGDESASCKAVSNDGTVMAGWEQTNQRVPVVWDEFGNPTHLPGFGEATVVSGDGSIVAGRGDGGAFIYDVAAQVFVNIGVLPGGWASAEALGITEDGSMIVGGHLLGGAPGLYEGWVWTQETGMVSIRSYLSSLGITEAASWDYQWFPIDVSADGQTILIAGGFANGKLFKTNVEPAVCELDFNGDGIITQQDHYGLSPTVDGIYYAAYTYLYKPNLFNQYFSHVDPNSLDWNGDGTITLEEVAPNVPFAVDSYYWQWFVYVYRDYIIQQYGTDYYALWWPNSGCP